MLRNYKTTIPALLILAAVGLYWAEYINKDQLETGVTLLVSVGLLGARDYSKNGGK